MEWGRLYANLPDDPRVQAAEDDGGAGWLLIDSMCYCTGAETGGFIPHTQVERFGGGPAKRRKIAALVREEIWLPVEGGYLLDPRLWTEEKNLSDQAEKKREADRRRIADKRARDRAQSSQNGHVSRDSSATSRATLSPVSDATSPGDSRRDSRTVEKRREEKNKPPPPPPPATLWPAAVPDPKTEGEGEIFPEDENPDLPVLVAEVRKIRPEWSSRSIRRALADPAVTERPWPLIRLAMLAVARHPESKHPGRLAHDGWWWLQDTPERPLPPSWCTVCDERTRMREDDQGRPSRCPECHPNAPNAMETA